VIEEAVIRYCATEAVKLTPQEITRIEQLPDAAHQVLHELECLLENSHPGAHVSLGQSQDRSWDDQTLWWLRWTDAGDRQWTHEPVCMEERGDDACLLPTGHVGQHHWA
jgi:hypothetical protein